MPSRRDFLRLLPVATVVVAGCHGGQGDEPLHPPVQDPLTRGVGAPEAEAPPALLLIRAFPLPPSAQPAIVFRAETPVGASGSLAAK